MEQTKKTEKKNEASTLFKIINSPVSIIVVLILFAIGLMIYNRYLINAMTLYSFTGYNDDISILNGTIYTGYDLNYFGDSKILFNDSDIEIYNYEVGYYIKDGKSYNEISVMKTLDETDPSASLKTVLESTDFSFTETHKDANYMSEENIKNIDNLVFRIVGEDEDGEKIEIEIPLTVSKITK